MRRRVVAGAGATIVAIVAAVVAITRPDEQVYFFPLAGLGCPPLDKRGLAWSYRGKTLAAPEALGLSPSFYWISWGSFPHQVGECDHHLPYLWGVTSQNGQPLLPGFIKNVPADYDGLVLFLNEADRPDQANMDYADAAALLVKAQDHCPGCQWVGPNYSNACDGGCATAFWREYLELGGDVGRIVAHGVHIYPDQRGLSAAQKLNLYYSTIPPWLVGLPVMVTEIGVTSCIDDPAGTLAEWLPELEADSRVIAYLGYSPYAIPEGGGCGGDFLPFMDESGKLTAVGAAFRGEGWSDWPVEAYP